MGAGRIFLAFLTIGSISFGGGVIAHLRNRLVTRHRWLDDRAFLDLLAVSQSLPGLNATNMAVLAGDRLRGALGALAAMAGICLPGAMLMFVVGMVYQAGRERPLVDAALMGVSAAAVGLILATILDLGRTSLGRLADLVFVALTVVGVNRLHVPVPRVLVVMGLLAAVWYGWTGNASRRPPR